VQLEDLLEAAAGVGLKDHREAADMLDVLLPGDALFQIAQRFLEVDALDIGVRGQRDRTWVGDAEPRAERRAEELIVGRAPPERVVDDHRAADHRRAQKCAVVGHLVRDTIHDHVVGALLGHAGAVELDELGYHAGLAPVDLLDKSAGEGVLAADHDADLLSHNISPQSESVKRKT
jgi:hypothetical protein